jgi:hypothetical protein
MDSAASKVCREKAIFYFHAVDNLGQAVIFDPGILKADYLVPYVEGEKWAGWYARIARRQLAKREELLTYVPVEIVADQYPYYYVVFLKPDTISDFEIVPENRPPLPGPPRLCRWIDLYTPSVKRK